MGKAGKWQRHNPRVTMLFRMGRKQMLTAEGSPVDGDARTANIAKQILIVLVVSAILLAKYALQMINQKKF